MLIGLDTNVLVYAEGLNDAVRKQAAVGLLRKLPPEDVYLPVQAVAELFHVLVMKTGIAPDQAKHAVLRWCDQYSLIDTSNTVLLSAMELSHHRLRMWDAIIMAAAASAGCRLLLSEDLQDGFTWSGVTVVNPFASKPNPLLEELLDS